MRDPDYAEKLIKIIEQYNLTEFDGTTEKKENQAAGAAGADDKKYYRVQAGAYRRKEGANLMAEQIKKTGHTDVFVRLLGGWGIVDGLVYENWKEQAFTLDDVRNCKTRCGLDFGYTNDPSASPIMFLDLENKKLYVWDELYKTGLSNKKIYEELSSMGYGKEKFTGDSAEPKSIDELKSLGLRIKGAKKGKDSINNGIQWIQDLEIIVHPRCVNFLTEISNYTWDKDKFGNKLNRPIDDFNHLMDAMRYGLEDDIIGNAWLY